MLQAIKSFEGYPKLRELSKLVPSLKPFKLNIILRFLERTGTVIIDGDGYIVWARGDKSEMSELSDIAEMSIDFKKFLNKSDR